MIIYYNRTMRRLTRGMSIYVFYINVPLLTAPKNRIIPKNRILKNVSVNPTVAKRRPLAADRHH